MTAGLSRKSSSGSISLSRAGYWMLHALTIRRIAPLFAWHPMNAVTPIGEPRIRGDRDTPKSRRTRSRILDAAMRLLAEVGYNAATNGRIADEAKLTRGAMLYHFPTREALIEAAVDYIQ